MAWQSVESDKKRARDHTRIKYEGAAWESSTSWKKEGIFDVLHLRGRSVQNDPHYVEPVAVAGALKPGDPDPCRTTELALLLPVDRGERAAEAVGRARFHFHEGDGSAFAIFGVASDYEIYVPMTVPEPPFEYLPPARGEPFFRDSFTLFACCLPSR